VNQISPTHVNRQIQESTRTHYGILFFLNLHIHFFVTRDRKWPIHRRELIIYSHGSTGMVRVLNWELKRMYNLYIKLTS